MRATRVARAGHGGCVCSTEEHSLEDSCTRETRSRLQGDRWRDTLIFREELRAIGESLIEIRGNSRSVMGYGRYMECLGSTTQNPSNRSFHVVLNFFIEMEDTGKDFRRERMKRLFVHLIDLLRLLDEEQVAEYMNDAYRRYQNGPA
jgi:hypothetical protein